MAMLKVGGARAPELIEDEDAAGRYTYETIGALLEELSPNERGDVAAALLSARPFEQLSARVREIFADLELDLYDDEDDDGDDEAGSREAED